MKLWQLSSIMRGQETLLHHIASRHSTYDMPLSIWHININTAIAIQDRAILDYILPEAFVKDVLSQCNRVAYIDAATNIIYNYPITAGTATDFLSLYNIIGADLLEELCEKDIVEIPRSKV